MAVEIGALRALLSLDSAAFEKGAKRAQASMGRLQRSMTQASERMRKVGRQMTTRVTLPLAGMAAVAVRSSLKTVDAQAKMAQSLDTSVVSLQNLTRASELAGISQSDLEGSLRRMTRRVSLAEQGTGAAVKALDRLNLSAEDLSDMPVDERVDTITSAIRDMIPAAEQAGVASQIFGDRTGLAIMRLDSDVISQAAREIDRFGVAVSDVDADQIEAANDALSSVGVAMRGLANQLTAALAPTLEALAQHLAETVAWFSDLSPRMQRMIAIAGTLAAAIGPLAIALGFVAAGIAALASPIGVAVLAFGALAGAVTYVATQWDSLKAFFAGVWSSIVEAARNGWERVKGILSEWTPEIVKAGWRELVSWFDDLWASIATGVSIGWSVIAGMLSGTYSPRALIKDAWSGITGWFRSLWADVEAVFAELWERIKSEVSQWPERMIQLGRDVVNGFIEGIRERLPNLGAEAAAMGRGVENAARRELETQSPSRKFMDIGRDLMDGLAIGISDNATAAADAAAGAAAQVTNVVEQSQGALGTFKQSVKTIFRDVLTGAKSFKDSLSGVLSSIGNRLIDAGIGQLVDAVFPSFAGGGFTGFGARTGGLDGRGGFPAILHPNETVVDHTRGGMGGQRLDVRVYVDEDGQWQGRVEQIAGGVTQRGLAAYDRQLPGRVQQSLVQGRNRRQNQAWNGS